MRNVWPKVMLLVAVILSTTAFGQGRIKDDWKIFAVDKSSVWTLPVDIFYLANETHQLPNGNVLVWTEAVSVNAIRAYVSKQTFARVDKRIDNRYIPPLYKISGNPPKSEADRTSTANAIAMMIIAEEVADEADVPVEAKMLEQIDCVNQRNRLMSVIGTTHGTSVNTNRPLAWEYIAPDTNMSVLATLVCPSKKSK